MNLIVSIVANTEKGMGFFKKEIKVYFTDLTIQHSGISDRNLNEISSYFTSCFRKKSLLPNYNQNWQELFKVNNEFFAITQQSLAGSSRFHQ